MNTLEKFKDVELEVKDGQSVKLIDVVSSMLADLGLKMSADGKFALPSMNVETRTVAEEAKTRAEASVKFIRDIVESKAVPTTGDSSYGATVPTGLYEQIMQKRDALAEIRKYSTVIPLAGKVQLGAEATMATTYWVAENASITESESSLAKITLEDHYLACRTKIPFKLLNGTPIAIEAYFADLMGRAIAKEEDAKFISGDDSAKPKGIRTTATDLGAIAGATLARADLIKLFYGVKAPYRKNGVWITSSLGVKAIMNIADTTTRPLFDPADGTLFGKPLIETENIPENLGGGSNTTEILFGDLKYYAIKDGEKLSLLSNPVNEQLQVQLVAFEAVDGELTLAEAVGKITAVK